MRTRTARRTRPANLSNREIATLPWSYFVVIAICGCIIAAGFLLAARQHFVSMDLGMKNSSLRKQLDDLKSENRRLMLAREIALSPAELTRTARNLGFVEIAEAPASIPVSVQPSTKPDGAIVVKAVATEARPATVQAVVKTAYQRPSETNVKAVAEKKNLSEKPEKSEKSKVVKTTLAAVTKR